MEDNKIGEKEMKKAPVSLSARTIVRERVCSVQVWVFKCMCVYMCTMLVHSAENEVPKREGV